MLTKPLKGYPNNSTHNILSFIESHGKIYFYRCASGDSSCLDDIDLQLESPEAEITRAECEMYRKMGIEDTMEECVD